MACMKLSSPSPVTSGVRLLYPQPETSREDWCKVSWRNHQQWPVLGKAHRQYHQEGKLHWGLPQEKYKEHTKDSEGHGLQDLRKTHTRVSLEYASSTWAPYTKHDNHNNEIVQRRAARFVTSDVTSAPAVSPPWCTNLVGIPYNGVEN